MTGAKSFRLERLGIVALDVWRHFSNIESFTPKVLVPSSMALLQRSQMVPEASEVMPEKLMKPLCNFSIASSPCPQMIMEDVDYDSDTFFEAFVWDWPFAEDRMAKGFLSKEKFFVCLPFNQGGTGESKGTLKKFEKISESDFSWTIGLCSSGLFGTCFWRFEIQILRNLNMLVLNASRDVSRPDETAKRLKRVRKVYRLPRHYDITTLTTASYDWAITIQANRRERKIHVKTLRRSVTV